ncbi:MerR family transcriptional regulator [Arsenicicoccus dermatophilus]|uniref:MerR family transcriptional regulator n=1 Tax=Arsenicicoccus dermatophilus TaxID=1076331 RepID=UPI001F4CEDD2|nr:MerR family DNA-binding transcriptional regulator [Arsenicicoccus dermatophilus]MCH8612282.1 MerR family DNA-binding transcriptional regulator [Arsenicicoccus dermatophilus]
MTTPDEWSIAQIAADFGVTHRTVRHYEDLGLLSPERRGTQRVYHRRERTRLGLILRGRRLGFPLEEIRTIVEMYDEAQGPTSQLRYVLDQIDDRREDLRQRLEDLRASMAELDRFEQRCREELARREVHRGPGPATPGSAPDTSPLSG